MVVKKPYTWEEIKEFLIKELKKTKHIMTFGVFGSLNIKNDLDVLITKKPESKSFDFYKEIHFFFENLDYYLNKNYKGRLIRVSRANHEEEVKYIVDYNPKKDLVIQATTYVSFPQIKKNWAVEFDSWGELNTKLAEIIRKQHFLLGSEKLLHSKKFNREIKNESIYGILDIHDRINSHLPKDLLINKMNILYDYILRKILKLKSIKAKNREQVKQIFYKICEKIEE